ncbi:HlyD family efflux transporter periplasmic adaptor subunit [Marinivivus vitaminiproducens]|uniref:HlyD family efflux transporter periplasmic adaptor subunit n=1 Tax=Marinivivus vitaminiproducens TaxID=3035935 RepID=UPI0027A4325E|nr:alginate biosynthesis protein Alg44 [Geminicoccaceae bacterium SCSIO 64248]
MHRQHVRLKIPILVEMDGVRYQVDDWSMGGFGIESELTSRAPGEKFVARLTFPFDSFDIAMVLDCQLVYILDQPMRFGCRFVSLNMEQVSLFRYLVDAYLSGEVISAGDVLQVRSRDNRAQARQTTVFNPFEHEEKLGQRMRRYAGYGALGVLGLCLVGLIAWNTRDRFLSQTVATGRVTATSFVLRAPQGGVTQRLTSEQRVTPGEPVAEIVAGTANSSVLISPCDCFVHEWDKPEGAYAQAGEAVTTLIAADAPLEVEAQLTVGQTERLRADQSATISFIGRDETLSATIASIETQSSLARPLNAEGDDATRVVLQPSRPLAFDDLGSLVRIHF